MGVRGSAAASIILYCLGVTDIDPLEHRLVFERFLNLERTRDARRRLRLRRRPPRRDDPLRRREVRPRPRRADHHLRDARREGGDPRRRPRARHVLRRRRPRRPPDPATRLAHDDRARARARAPSCKQLYEADPTGRASSIDTARELEGVARHASTHAAGVVISPRAAGRTRAAAAPVLAATPTRCRRRSSPWGRRRDRPAEDGLPRPHQPHDPRHAPSS